MLLLPPTDEMIPFYFDNEVLDISGYCEMLREQPDRELARLQQVLIGAQRRIKNEHPLERDMSLKKQVQPRIRFPTTCINDQLPSATDLNKLCWVRGTVVRVSSVRTLELKREYTCMQCGTVFLQQAEIEQNFAIRTPTSCPTGACDGRKFKSVGTIQPHLCCDYQDIKMQQCMNSLEFGTIPQSIHVILLHDLVDSCKAGDDVDVSAVVRQRWLAEKPDERCVTELVLEANSVVITNDKVAAVNITDDLRQQFERHWSLRPERPLSQRNEIIASFCPQVYGLYVVKIAVMLVMTGGVPHVDATGTRTRGESHLLLVGDPGTGKSQFLKYAAKLIPRSVLTTGVGSTSAGLTVTAVKEDGKLIRFEFRPAPGEWTLEAGALVLADGGLCCIDEFNGIREHDRGAIHEAMEQQTLSVAKAGLVCKLKTRTSVLAATNPKGSYDVESSLSINVAMASPLLSRFDIIMVLLDVKNAEWDTVVSDFILGECSERTSNPGTQQPSRDLNGGATDLWGMNKLKAYLAYIKSFDPGLSKPAERVLSRYYQLQRMADTSLTARTTIRLLESLVRLAQAHARIMCHGEVTLMDAVVAVTIIESSMQGASLLGACSPLHSCFPDDAEAEYLAQEALVLEKLGFPDLLGTTRLQTNQGWATSRGPIKPSDGSGEGGPGPGNNAPHGPHSPTNAGNTSSQSLDGVLGEDSAGQNQGPHPTQAGYMFFSQAATLSRVKAKRLERAQQRQSRNASAVGLSAAAQRDQEQGRPDSEAREGGEDDHGNRDEEEDAELDAVLEEDSDSDFAPSMRHVAAKRAKITQEVLATPEEETVQPSSSRPADVLSSDSSEDEEEARAIGSTTSEEASQPSLYSQQQRQKRAGSARVPTRASSMASLEVFAFSRPDRPRREGGLRGVVASGSASMANLPSVGVTPSTSSPTTAAPGDAAPHESTSGGGSSEPVPSSAAQPPPSSLSDTGHTAAAHEAALGSPVRRKKSFR
ncbi:uncharacterized protein MONBRDRAFT_32709 [Monosiga brevicollis MX1]|uniref:MCM C-terminal AAA(+) ATPase domain-containing protein n=1 Tax=Monosiga brevicollis TaxID=81824 RepID=A9V184_MONBE|nr:uncharacterized protein MONBRDRAFT_32709 [Monosiga brevicollis MX1]EDQ88886.1 predicted protein [Monosiga brevicollis MX1]|eukprot:XP_001746499.1 hypothetical protein [Monosiga brevicollis MX1]